MQKLSVERAEVEVDKSKAQAKAIAARPKGESK